MIAPDFNSLCKQAELYYYDFIFNESREPIPEFIVNHIEQCKHCQEQVNQLNGVLSQTEDYVELEQGQAGRAVTIMLKLHFAYIGKPVTCEIVKPFLPSLLEPALEIRVPTPITAHLDNCQQCSEDLETIRKLNLNRKQLRRLSQLFAEKPGEDNVSCSQAQAAILAVVSMAFRETNKEVLKHLCICPNCRKVLYQYRETVRKEYPHNRTEREKFPCEAVSTTDIFDYAVPYGLDPAKNQYAKFRQSLTSHMRTCPTCLAKMQQLHDIVYGIAERAESEVVTIYHIDKSAEAKATSESDDLYAGFPIRAEVMGREEKVKTEQPARTIDFGTALKQRVSAKKLKPLLKTAVPAAAVILIGVALLLHVPAAKAVTIDRIYKAIEKVKNVYITSFVPDQAEPTQEKWVSRSLNVYITKTGKQLVLWDIANMVRKSKQLDADSVETSQLSTEMITEIQNTITGSLGLMPFYDISDIPANAKWNSVADEALQAATEGIEVYDLTWPAKAFDGSLVFKKWRFFADPKADLPQRIEIYQMLTTDTEYTLISLIVVEYLDNGEMQELIKEASF